MKEIDMDGFTNELAAALDAAEKKEAELMSPKEETQEEVVEEKEATEAPEEKSTEVKELEKDDEQFPLIPKEWTAEEKEEFEAVLANPELKKSAELMITRYDNLKKGFYKKADELANTKKEVSEWNEIFDPYKDALKQRGYTPTAYVGRLISVDRRLSAEPEKVIKELMEAYKVTPEKLGISNGADDYYENDEISQLKQKIESLEKTYKNTSEVTERQTEEANLRAIRDFKFAIDETGEPKHPLFEEVKEEMAILLNTGKATSLEDAYLKSPTVKEKLAEAEKERRSKDELEAARKKAAMAKKASKGVKNTSDASYSGASTKDLSELLKEGFREAGYL